MSWVVWASRMHEGRVGILPARRKNQGSMGVFSWESEAPAELLVGDVRIWFHPDCFSDGGAGILPAIWGTSSLLSGMGILFAFVSN